MNLKVITREKYVLDDNVFNGFFENVFNLTAIEYTLKSILKNKGGITTLIFMEKNMEIRARPKRSYFYTQNNNDKKVRAE